MNSKRYANAQEVLSEDLLGLIQQHYTGIWIPAAKTPAEHRRELVIRLYRQDHHPREIAPLVGVTTRSVQQIVASL